MASFVPTEKATPIRQPSTANLCIDSADRRRDASGVFIESVWDFTINRPQSILNGFFTRVGMTETYLKWDVPNISKSLGNNTLLLDISGYGSNPITILFPNQFCGTAAAVLDSIAAYVNDLSGTTNFYFTIAPNQGGGTKLASQTWQLIGNNVPPGTNGGFFKFRDTPLARQMNIYSPTLGKYQEPTSPDLRPYTCIDFVSPNLTYNQDLKDATTNSVVVDVLQRFYFSYAAENTYDKYNFPILMGYKPFVYERMYNPPKQIRWDPSQPIGQIQLQVWGLQNPTVTPTNGVFNPLTNTYTGTTYGPINLNPYFTNYGFTLQVSEV